MASYLEGNGAVNFSLNDCEMIRFRPSFSETAAALKVEPVREGRQLIRSLVVSLNMIGFFRNWRSRDPSSLDRSGIRNWTCLHILPLLKSIQFYVLWPI